MAIRQEGNTYYGLSTDTKPTGAVLNGREFREMDTGKKYLFDEENGEWLEQPEEGGGGGGGSSTLAGLTDVDISNPSDGQTLVYNASAGKWENGAGGGSGSYTAQSPITINNGVIGFDGYQYQGSTLLAPTSVTVGPETVDGGSFIGDIELQQQGVLTFPELRVTFNGVTYLCSRYDYGGYVDYGAMWNDTTQAYDYSEYPFCVESDSDGLYLITPEAGTYTLKIEVGSIEVTPDFKDAVIVAAGSLLPMLCVPGQTTAAEVSAAIEAHRLMYFMYRDDGYMFVSQPYTTENQPWDYVPNSGNPCTVYMQNGVFTLIDNT